MTIGKVFSIYKYSGTNGIYIGRKGHGQDGYFGNPFRPGEYCGLCRNVHHSPTSTLPCYEIYLKKRLETDEEFKNKCLNLYGKDLLCFCVKSNLGADELDDIVCHGQVLLREIKKIRESGS